MSRGIEARGVTAERAGRMVLRDVGFDAARGHVLAVVGASGSGKSTLLRCLNRLTEPRAGSITLDGTDIRALEPQILRRRIALVAQHPAMLPGTVAANLAYGLDTLTAAARDAALSAAGLDASYAARPATALSGGERARVALARALTRAPEALLLDEPTAALDAGTASRIAATITALARRDLIVIVATHDLALAEAVADATLRLEGGAGRPAGAAPAREAAPPGGATPARGAAPPGSPAPPGGAAPARGAALPTRSDRPGT